MIKKLCITLFFLSSLTLLTSCTPSTAKDIIRKKHAQSYVLSRRINDDNPNNDPTIEQLRSFATSTAKDWESLDRLINNWKPGVGMKSMDLEGKIDE
jgi:hypothetical protein